VQVLVLSYPLIQACSRRFEGPTSARNMGPEQGECGLSLSGVQNLAQLIRNGSPEVKKSIFGLRLAPRDWFRGAGRAGSKCLEAFERQAQYLRSVGRLTNTCQRRERCEIATYQYGVGVQVFVFG